MAVLMERKSPCHANRFIRPYTLLCTSIPKAVRSTMAARKLLICDMVCKLISLQYIESKHSEGRHQECGAEKFSQTEKSHLRETGLYEYKADADNAELQHHENKGFQHC